MWIQWLQEQVLNAFFGYENGIPYCYECNDCRHIQTADEVQLSSNTAVKEVCDHQLGDWTRLIDATCSAMESEGRICAICSRVIEVRTKQGVTGLHSWGEWYVIVAPSCSATGTDERECSVCHEKKTRTTNALGHDHSPEWTVDLAPTCTKAGSKSYHCTRCGDRADVTEIPANNHAWGEWSSRAVGG